MFFPHVGLGNHKIRQIKSFSKYTLAIQIKLALAKGLPSYTTRLRPSRKELMPRDIKQGGQKLRMEEVWHPDIDS